MTAERIELISFDCYGTLIDWERGILSALDEFRDANGVDAADDALLELYARIESGAQSGAYRPYRDVLREVMRGMAAHYRVEPDRFDEDALVKSLPRWVPFSDTVDSLHKLRERYRLAIISNVDDDLFAHTARRLAVPFDYIVTAEQVGAYKPSLETFAHAERTFGVAKANWLHAAQSLFHDVGPAREFGLTTAWIDRRRDREGSGATPPSTARPSMTFPHLAAFAQEMAGARS